MKQEKKQEKHMVDVAIRVLQYPFARLTRSHKNRIEYHTKKEKITYTTDECITTEDAEKLFAAIYLARHARYTVIEDHEVVVTECSLYDLRRLTRLHDYHAIVRSLRKFTSITLEVENATKKISSGFIYRVESDEEGNSLRIMFHRLFYEACRRGLRLNLAIYSQLSPIAKNIYCVIISHCSYSTFSEDFLLERSQITAIDLYKARQLLKKALQELADCGIIRSFLYHRRNQKYIYFIHRKGKKKNKHK